MAIPRGGAPAVLRAMVGAPTGALDVASLTVGMPAVGIESGLVAAPIGVSGLVPARTVDVSGIVGAPVANGALAGAPAVGVRGAVGAPLAVIGIPVGAAPTGPVVLRGIVGAGVGAFGAIGAPPVGCAGGPVSGALLADTSFGGVLVVGLETKVGAVVGVLVS